MTYYMEVASWKPETPDGTYVTRVDIDEAEYADINRRGGAAMTPALLAKLPPMHEWTGINLGIAPSVEVGGDIVGRAN